MLCENCREPLRDAAASGGEMTPQLRAHLDACDECRAALACERLLLAEIDEGLRAAANATLPPSLLPRVRAELALHPARSRRVPALWAWAPTVVLASLAVAIFVPRLVRNFRSDNSPVISVHSDPSSDSGEKIQPGAPPARVPSVYAERKRITSQARILALAAEPKVLVPPGQETALAHYIALLQRQPVLAQSVSEDKSQKPLRIEPLEIAELSSQPLAIEPLAPDAGGTTQ